MEANIITAISISLKVSITATIIGFLISLPLGGAIAIKKFPAKNTIISIINAFTSIPPVCAGLLCYFVVSRSGPFGWMGIIYTPSAMILAQLIIIIPIMTSLTARNIGEDYPAFKEELASYGASFIDIVKLLFVNNFRIYFTIGIIGFGRAISEYGAAAIVGGSIDQVTRNMSATIALETSKGNLDIALQLGFILLAISFIASLLGQFRNKK